MGRSRFDRLVLRKAWASPWVWLFGGVGAILLGWWAVAGGGLGFWGWTGVGSLALGMGVAGWRWLFAPERLIESVEAEARGEAERRERLRLRRLWRRFRAEGDRRPAGCVDRLKRLRSRMAGWDAVPAGGRGAEAVLAGLHEKACELYGSCVASLERCVELGQAARDMATAEARQEVLATRDSLLGEVVRSVDHLAATLDHLQSAGLRHRPEEEHLGRVRQELEVGLEVERRVTERVGRLEASLRERE